jgi:hypothetical protein
MKKIILQFLADSIIEAMKNTTDYDVLNVLYYYGNMIDSYAIYFHEIYLK